MFISFYPPSAIDNASEGFSVSKGYALAIVAWLQIRVSIAFIALVFLWWGSRFEASRNE